MALHSLYCADVPLRNCSLTHSAVFGHLCTVQEYFTAKYSVAVTAHLV